MHIVSTPEEAVLWVLIKSKEGRYTEWINEASGAIVALNIMIM